MATWPIQTDVMGKAGVENAANTFVPQLWADEILVSREKNLVAASFFKRINHKGKAGDTINIPFISNLTTNDKVETQPVTLQVIAEGKKQVLLNKHKETSFLIEDFLKIQSKYDLRSEYTKKGGYAHALVVDTDIFALFVADLPAAYKVIGSDGITAFGGANEADLTDAGLRRAIQTLDDNLAPQEGRCLFIPPSQKNALLGINKFTLFEQLGRTQELHQGTFGSIYGITVKVSTNVPTVGNARVSILTHKDSVCCAMQQDVRVQSDYKLQNIATLVVLDSIYGVKSLRLDVDDVSSSNNRLCEAVGIYTP